MANEETKNSILDATKNVYIENDITRRLDDALEMCGEKRPNTYISGLTGSGKTASVKAWLEKHSEINGIYLDCLAYTEPLMGKILFHDDLTLCGQLFSEEVIDSIKSRDTVVVLDNYHFADYNVKQHVCLLCDGYAVDSRNPENFEKLDTLRFVCVIATEMV